MRVIISSMFLLLVGLMLSTTACAFPAAQFWDSDAVSLSDRVSSPERYAQALNMTMNDVRQRKEKFEYLSNALHQQLQDPSLTAKEKHQLQCNHRYLYGRHPFTCPDCWSYQPVCLCDQIGDRRLSLPYPEQLQVLIWTHHREWGLTSNTGSVVARSVDNCRMLMKGLEEHDKILLSSCVDDEDDDSLSIVLWPDSKNSKAKSITLDEVKMELSNNSNRKVNLICIDGTWRNARRMVGKLPDSVRRLDLPLESVFSDTIGEETKTSILAPLRSRGPSTKASSERQVCTAEAIVGALRGLGWDDEPARIVLEYTKRKVDLIRRYRGKV
jgi:DTW domain-containing protein YfiP